MRARNVPALLLVFSLLFLGFSPETRVAAYKGYERPSALITASELKQQLEDPDQNPVVLAVAKPVLEYRLGHIPGAQNVWRPDYEPPIGQPWPYDGMILDRGAFQDFARKLGIDDDSKIVVYDHKYDATRLWWAFFLYGKTDVRVLDGGYDAWVAAEHDVNRFFAAEEPDPGNFTARGPRPGWTAQLGDLWRAKTSKEWHVWDTRSEAEWNGVEVKGNATCGGRVPWAERLNWTDFKQPVNKQYETPTAFRPAGEPRSLLKHRDVNRGDHHIFYCQSGVRCTTDLFALYLLGYDPDHLHNYDGSWLEWSYHYCAEEVNRRPIERGSLISKNP